MNIYIFLIFW